MSSTDPYAPNYELIIGGSTLAPDFYKLIKRVEFDDESNKISSLKFDIEFSKPVKGGVSVDLINMKIISPGNLVVLKGGYGNDLQTIGSAYIVDLEPTFPANSPPRLTVTCYDHLWKASVPKSEKGEIHQGIADHQIVQIYGIKHNMLVSQTSSALAHGIRSTKGRLIRTQKRGTSDLAFLQELAKLNSYELYTKYNTKVKKFELFFEPPNDQSKPLFTFIWGDGSIPYDIPPNMAVSKPLTAVLQNFTPKLSVTTQFTKYVVSAYDKVSNKKIDITLTMDDFMKNQKDIKLGGPNADSLLKKDAAVSGAGVTKKAFGESTEVITKKVFENAEDARKYLVLHMKKIAKDFIRGNGGFKGNNLVKSRQVHNIGGLGAYFNGRYYFEHVKHVFDDRGYNCSFDSRRVLLEETA